jgi:DNA topoisomerase-2
LTIEDIYQKKTQLEHILLRPDTYIGSTEAEEQDMWVYDSEGDKIVRKKIKYVPGLYKIIDEILVNAADNKVNERLACRFINTLYYKLDSRPVNDDDQGDH